MKNIKKVELHLHLDGSVRIETIKELSGLPLETVKENMQVQKDCTSLIDYLTKFELPLKYMQVSDNLTRITKELIEDLEKDNVIYAEIRFAPSLHTKEGLTLEEVVDAVLLGIKYSKIKVGIILCMMRGDTKENNLKIIELTKKYLDKGVCAIDLAGSEQQYPNHLYKELFDEINKLEIPFTIHSGEASGASSVIQAVDFNTTRIGHGINLENNQELINTIKNKNILLEICPTSNIQTKAVDNISCHPIYNYYKLGLPISINTDNRTVSNITLTSEYQLLKDTFGFTKEDFTTINKMSLEHAFIDETTKKNLINILETNR